LHTGKNIYSLLIVAETSCIHIEAVIFSTFIRGHSLTADKTLHYHCVPDFLNIVAFFSSAVTHWDKSSRNIVRMR